MPTSVRIAWGTREFLFSIAIIDTRLTPKPHQSSQTTCTKHVHIAILYINEIYKQMTRKLLITLDNELDPWLAKQPNQAETVRKALTIYKSNISTDTIDGLRESYKHLLKTITSRFDAYDESFKKMDRLIEYIETRMQ